MTLLGVLRGLSAGEVVGEMAFRPRIAREIAEIPPPTDAELRLLREEIDPSRVIIRGDRMTAPA
jgi:glutaconate CoA-transferase, subunit B